MLVLMMPKHPTVAALSASASPSSVSGQRTIPGTGVVTTGPTTTTASGGVPGYTYAWEYVSGDTLTVTNPTSATTTFSRLAAEGTEFIGVYRCEVTDAASGVVYTNNVTATVLGYQP